jgi:iron complex outermembrane recepter protein
MLSFSLSRWLKLSVSCSIIAYGAMLNPASANEMAAAESEAQPKEEIIVVGTRMQGAVETDIPPTEVLNEADIAAVGGSSIADVLSAVAPQAGSGRGRGGGGPPVILLNGQRISNFRELRDLPPEAIRQVQIFPEEVALQYGFRPNQRVINFILKDNFASFSGETEYAAPEKGGFDRKEFETTLTRIGKTVRFNVDIEFESQSRLTEDERNIVSSATAFPYALSGNVTGIGGGSISPALDIAAGRPVTVAAVPANPTLAGFAASANQAASGDISEYRSLLPSFQRFQINSSWSKQLAPQTNLSLNASFETRDDQSLIGLPFASLIVPASSSFTPFANDVQLNRYFETPRPLTRNSRTESLQFGAGFNTVIKDWRLALTADYDIATSKSQTFTNTDFTALRTAISAGSVNPFAANLGSDLLFANPDTSQTTAKPLELRGTLTGKPVMLPAGPVLLTLSGGFDRRSFDTSASRRGVFTNVSLRRDNIRSAVNLEIPLIERGTGALGAIGDVSVNANYGLTDVSDVGTINEYGAGVRWSPIEGLSLSASIIGDENAATLSQLGNPLVVTPNIAVFDFTRGESRFVELVTGGNPALIGEKRRDFKLSADWSPKFIKDLSLQLEYFKNRSTNTTSTFPLLTPEIEAAFPGRVTRDADGRLLRVDQRPVNFDQEQSQQIRWSFNISGNLGKPAPGGGMGMFGGMGGGRPPGAAGAPPTVGGARPPAAAGTPATTPNAQRPQPPAGPPAGARPGGGRGGFGGGMMGGGMGGPNQSRWSLALSHTIKLQDEVLIRAGVPVLDLLNGSATSSLGGSPRHELTLSGGVFHKGMGVRVEGTYRSGTRVDGNTLTGTSDLTFSDLASLNAFFFINLDQRGNLTKNVKWLKGSRIAFRVFNVLGDVIDVRDANGVVPLTYQPGLLDPQGRVFELSFRKRF